MRFIFIVLTVSYVMEVVACKDVEVNADVRLDPTLVQYLKQALDEELELGYFRTQSDEDGPIMEVIKDNALHELLQENLPEITSEGNTIQGQIHAFEKRAQQKGVDCIQAITDHVEKKLNLSHADLALIVKKITSDYTTMLKKYFSDLARERPDCHVDREYIILDMVNVVSLIRNKIERTLLDNILALAQNTDDNEIEILTGTLDMFNDNDKRQEMDFMCANFKVCRPNPTFSDYVFKLLDVVLKLNNNKFHYFLIKCSQLLLNKQSLFETVLRDEIVAFLRMKLNSMPTANITEMRKVVSFLHSIIIRRYKIDRTNNKKIHTKAKSAYIILDIVDIAFGIDGNDLYGPQMEKETLIIKEWSTTFGNDIETTLHDVIQYIVEALNYNLTKRAREEIMALADILFYDKSEKVNEAPYLFTEGSKFVKGLIHRPEAKKLW